MQLIKKMWRMIRPWRYWYISMIGMLTSEFFLLTWAYAHGGQMQMKNSWWALAPFGMVVWVAVLLVWMSLIHDRERRWQELYRYIYSEQPKVEQPEEPK